MSESLDRIDFVLFTLGTTPIRLSALLSLLVAVLLLLMVSRLLERWLVQRALARTRLDVGARTAIGTLARYTILIIGFAVVMQNIGINLAALGVLAGALGVGIGFGLQNIFSNFISGLIVMIERPVKIGDRIDIGGIEGDVVAIGARSTTLTTARRARVYVPNQKFITEFVRNWDAESERTSLIVTLKIAAAHEPRQVEALLAEAARATPGVVDRPAPTVDLTGLAGGGYGFQLQVWSVGDAEDRARLLSALHFNVFECLRQAQIKLA